jgi:hypothetical protein
MTTTAKRNAYTFKEGLTMMAAKSVGIDPYLAAEAGEGAKSAINAIRHAAKTKNPQDRAALIRQAQVELRTINAARHPKVVNAIQARLLALQGRGGDTEIAHVTPGEVVIPRSLQTPQLMRQIAVLAARQGLDPRQLTVGHRANKVNPQTGQREFLDDVIVTGKPYPAVTIPRPTKMPYDPRMPIGKQTGTGWGLVWDTRSDGFDDDSSGGDSQYQPGDFARVTREMDARLDKTVDDLANAAIEDLQWSWYRLADLKDAHDLSIFKFLGAAHRSVAGPGASRDSALQPTVNYYADLQTQVMQEINRRIENGTWGDATVPSNANR